MLITAVKQEHLFPLTFSLKNPHIYFLISKLLSVKGLVTRAKKKEKHAYNKINHHLDIYITRLRHEGILMVLNHKDLKKNTI